jgi:hypothetical protein
LSRTLLLRRDNYQAGKRFSNPDAVGLLSSEEKGCYVKGGLHAICFFISVLSARPFFSGSLRHLQGPLILVLVAYGVVLFLGCFGFLGYLSGGFLAPGGVLVVKDKVKKTTTTPNIF